MGMVRDFVVLRPDKRNDDWRFREIDYADLGFMTILNDNHRNL